jgi:hypothetical protein
MQLESPLSVSVDIRYDAFFIRVSMPSVEVRDHVVSHLRSLLRSNELKWKV